MLCALCCVHCVVSPVLCALCCVHCVVCTVLTLCALQIGDFGLTASMPSKDTNGRVPVPLRWAPPEVIENNEYSTMSDIWSYGVVLYEIWSLGKIPYGDLSNQEVRGDTWSVYLCISTCSVLHR